MAGRLERRVTGDLAKEVLDEDPPPPSFSAPSSVPAYVTSEGATLEAAEAADRTLGLKSEAMVEAMKRVVSEPAAQAH